VVRATAVAFFYTSDYVALIESKFIWLFYPIPQFAQHPLPSARV
jgi:hypothetical protein